MSPSGATPPDPDGQIAWHRMLLLSRRVLRELDLRLGEEHRIGINEFDVLITLDNADSRRMRMTDLANAVMFSSGGLTRLVGRLESRGLVQRTPDPGDGRSFHATFTELGSERLAEARVTHDAVIEELVASRLSSSQLTSLGRSLGRLIEP